jgi:uncharacterized protein YndB with AHSA1/START domain
MSESTELAEQVFSILIKAPRERVWEEITKTGRIQLAMVNTVLEGTLAPGCKLRYYSANKQRVLVVGEVVEIDPPRRFAHTFMFTTRPETPSLVTWELKETSEGCEVTLIHGGWTDQTQTHKGVGQGWRDILALLKGVVETGRIPLRTRFNYALLDAMQFMLPRATTPDEVARAGW